jgi:hypothetical protein
MVFSKNTTYGKLLILSNIMTVMGLKACAQTDGSLISNYI